MGWLSEIAGIAGVITGNPAISAIGGLLDSDEEQSVGTSTAAQSNMTPEMQALMKKTTTQIADDLAKLVAGDSDKIAEYKAAFKGNKSVNLEDFDKLVKPIMNEKDTLNQQVLASMAGNKDLLTKVDAIEALSDRFNAVGNTSKAYTDAVEKWKTDNKYQPVPGREQDPAALAAMKKAGTEAWLKAEMGTAYDDVAAKAFSLMTSVSPNYQLGDLTSTLNKMDKAEDYQKQVNLIHDAGLQTPSEYFADVAKKYEGFKAQQDEIYSKYNEAEAQLGKLAIPNMTFTGKDMAEAESAVKSHFAGEPIKQGFYNLNGQIRYYKDGKFLSKDEYAQLPVGTPDGIDYQTRKDAYLQEFDNLGTAAANLADKTAIEGNLAQYQKNLDAFNAEVQKGSADLYSQYRKLQESTKTGMPDFLTPTTIYDYPGDLTTKASTDELNIQKDIREELAGIKTYDDYAKMVNDAKTGLLNSNKDAMVKAAVGIGKSQTEAFNASPEQLFQWLSQSTDANAQAVIKDFNNQLSLVTDKTINSATPDIKAAFETIKQIQTAMNLQPVDFTEFINDFKTGRNATENEKKYQNILMNMAEQGMGEDLTGKIYGAATSDVNKKAKDEQARIDALMSARGLGASSALTDQQRLVEEEAQRLREKAGLEASVESAKLNQGAKEYGISTGTSLEKQLADRFLGGTASAAELKAKQDAMNREQAGQNVELAKQQALIQTGTQQAAETKRDKLRTELLNLAQTQEARDAANKQNIYNEFIRRLNARENKIAQGVNAVSGTGMELAQLNTQTATQQYLQNLKNQQAQNQLISQTLGSIYKPKNKTTVSQPVDNSDDYDLWGGNTSDYLADNWWE